MTDLHPRRDRATKALWAAALFIALLCPAAAQDIRGLEVCTSEKQMERRTGCLQANVEFLQQTLSKLSRETKDRLDAAGRDVAAARAEIAVAKNELAAVKAALAKLETELVQVKAKAEASGKK